MIDLSNIDEVLDSFLEKTSNVALHIKAGEMTPEDLQGHYDAMSHHASAIEHLRAQPEVQAALKGAKQKSDFTKPTDPHVAQLMNHSERFLAHAAHLHQLQGLQGKGHEHPVVVKLDAPGISGSASVFQHHMPDGTGADGSQKWKAQPWSKGTFKPGVREYHEAAENPDHPSFGKPKSDYPFGQVKVNGVPLKVDGKQFESADAIPAEHPHDARAAQMGAILPVKLGGSGRFQGSKTIDRQMGHHEKLNNTAAAPAEGEAPKKTNPFAKPALAKHDFGEVSVAQLVLADNLLKSVNPYEELTDRELGVELGYADNTTTTALVIAEVCRRHELLKAEDDSVAGRAKSVPMPKIHELPPEIQERKMQPTKTPSGRDVRLPHFDYSGPAHPDGKLTEYDHDEEIYSTKPAAREFKNKQIARSERNATDADNPATSHQARVKQLTADLRAGKINAKGFAAQMKGSLATQTENTGGTLAEGQVSEDQKKIQGIDAVAQTGYKPSRTSPKEEGRRAKQDEMTDTAYGTHASGSASAKEMLGGATGEGDSAVNPGAYSTKDYETHQVQSNPFLQQFLVHRDKALSHYRDNPAAKDYVEHLVNHVAETKPKELPLLVESLRQAHAHHHGNVFDALGQVAKDHSMRDVMQGYAGGAAREGSERFDPKAAEMVGDAKARGAAVMQQPDEVGSAGDKAKPKVIIRRKAEQQ